MLRRSFLKCVPISIAGFAMSKGVNGWTVDFTKKLIKCEIGQGDLSKSGYYHIVNGREFDTHFRGRICKVFNALDGCTYNDKGIICSIDGHLVTDKSEVQIVDMRNGSLMCRYVTQNGQIVEYSKENGATLWNPKRLDNRFRFSFDKTQYTVKNV